ncbi:MAG: N-acetylmuramoyl-L-alanine amidase [Paracoccaceae bacterium]
MLGASRAMLLAVLLIALPLAVAAQGLHGLATLDVGASRVEDHGQGLQIRLRLSQPVPYRVSFLNQPARMIVDFQEVDFGPTPALSINRSTQVAGMGWGPFLAGWSRLVLILEGPQLLQSAELRQKPGGAAEIVLITGPATAEAFADHIARAEADAGGSAWALPPPAELAAPRLRQTGDRPLRVVLDPGHGGLDPGAEAEGVREADLMLTFARELAEKLRRAGMDVVLTRDDDRFVPLSQRVSLAQAAAADIFISLHADALQEGVASGSTLYLLDEEASDKASADLAALHDRGELLAGVDLAGQEDAVAGILLEMVRRETRPRSEKLAEAMVAAFQSLSVPTHSRPIRNAAFSVLRSADMPSVLLETSFLSSPKDRARLLDPVARALMQEAILLALQRWAAADAAEALLLRQ